MMFPLLAMVEIRTSDLKSKRSKMVKLEGESLDYEPNLSFLSTASSEVHTSRYASNMSI